MAMIQTVFPMISVRNPWGFLIQNGFKTIENRKKQLGKEFHNTWIALHVSKTFKTTEEKYAHKYLKNHQQLLDSNHYTSKQKQMEKFFGPRKLNDRQKISNLINSQLKPQMSNIIAFIKISKCVSSFEAKKIDPIYADQPFAAESHWVISDTIPLQPKEYCSTRGHMGCARITDTSLNQLLSNILKCKLQERDSAKEDKENVSQTDNKDDDEILDILETLDNEMINASPNAKQSGHKRKHQDIIDETEIDSSYCPQPKKIKTNPTPTSIAHDETKTTRKLPTFVVGAPSPKTHRLKWMNQDEHKHDMNTNTDSNTFEKLSRNNSLYNMKRDKVDLMISTERAPDNCGIVNDIDAELNSIMEERIQNEKKDENKQYLSKAMQQRLYSNPNELRRKQHLQLPDQYEWRVIVFDTETASFKPLGSIIDIGAVELINGKLTGRKFQAYIKPWAKIHPEAMKVHGITADFLNRYAEGDIYQITQSFMEWIHADCICMQCQTLKGNASERKHKLKLVGHNVTFDINHLNGAIEHCQSKLSDEHKIWKPIDIESTFDTLLYFRNVLGNHGNYSLDGMCYKFGIKTDERKHSHGALVDAMVTAKCLQEMWKRDKDIKERKCSNRFFTKKL